MSDEEKIKTNKVPVVWAGISENPSLRRSYVFWDLNNA